MSKIDPLGYGKIGVLVRLHGKLKKWVLARSDPVPIRLTRAPNTMGFAFSLLVLLFPWVSCGKFSTVIIVS